MPKVKRIAASALVALIVLCIGAGTFVFYSAVRSKGPSGVKPDPHDPVGQTMRAYTQFGDGWLSQPNTEKLTIRAKDGVRLQGYLVRASVHSRKLAVLVHGYGVDARMMTPFGALYHEMGYNVFLADDRGLGNSGGKYVGFGWLDRLDYLQWLDVLITRMGPDTQIVLHGVSMGGATVMMMSGEQLPVQVKCIVEDAGYSSVSEEIDYQIAHMFHLPPFPVRQVASAESRLFAGYSFEEASALKQVRKSRTPILFIHGGADTFNPTRMVYELYGAAACQKELLIVPGAMHALAFHDAPELYTQTVKKFSSKYVGNI